VSFCSVYSLASRLHATDQSLVAATVTASQPLDFAFVALENSSGLSV